MPTSRLSVSLPLPRGALRTEVEHEELPLEGPVVRDADEDEEGDDHHVVGPELRRVLDEQELGHGQHEHAERKGPLVDRARHRRLPAAEAGGVRDQREYP